MWDPFEFYGTTLRVAASLGWVYVGSCPGRKVTKYMNEHWLEHLKHHVEISLVCIIQLAVVLIT